MANKPLTTNMLNYYNTKQVIPIKNAFVNFKNLKGVNDGLAELGPDGKVKDTQLPKFVSVVSALPATGKADVLYIIDTDNTAHVWNGSGYKDITVDFTKLTGVKSITESNGTLTITNFDGTTKTITVGSKLNIASATELGGVKVGNNLTIDENGVLSGNYDVASKTANGLMSADDKTKLDGLADSASEGAVKSVNGKTGVVTIAKEDLNLGNVNNTADVDKPVSKATQTALDLKANKTDLTGKANGEGISFSVNDSNELVAQKGGADVTIGGGGGSKVDIDGTTIVTDTDGKLSVKDYDKFLQGTIGLTDSDVEAGITEIFA